MLPSSVACGQYVVDGKAIPQLTASASRDKAGKVHVSVSNLDPNRPAPLVCQFQGFAPKQATGRVLTAGSISAHNTFDQPRTIEPKPLDGIVVAEGRVSVTLPPKSVVVLALE